MFSVHTIFQNICKSEKVQIPPVVEVAVLQFHERWQLPELSSSFFFFCCNAISRIISSCVVSLVNFRGGYQQFWDFSRLLEILSFLTLFFCPSCCLLCLMRSRRRRVSSCEFARLLIVVSGIGRFT